MQAGNDVHEKTQRRHTVTNPFLELYMKHEISPVHQDLSDIKTHYIRRENLYRQLGLPIIAFKDKRILEIGPGSGYNTLAFFKWGAIVDLVEPNPKARHDIYELFGNYDIPRQSYTVCSDVIEDFNTDKRYPIIICEGFLPCLENKQEIINKLISLLEPNGIIVNTCLDEFSMFYERLRKIIARKLIGRCTDFDKNVDTLVKAFETHFNSLKRTSRCISDWVIDEYLNDALDNELMSIADCMGLFGDSFDYLGSSPHMFTDYTWYKDITHDYNAAVIDQFNKKRHLLMTMTDDDTPAEKHEIDRITRYLKKIKHYAVRYDMTLSSRDLKQIIYELKSMDIWVYRSNNGAIGEAVELLEDKNLTPEKVSNAMVFGSAFGRGQQYLSMVKRSD